MNFLKEECSQRRNKIFHQLNKNSVAILFNRSEVNRNADTEYPYRPASNFYYLTGFEEANAIAVLIPTSSGGDYFLFHLPRDLAIEQWTGKRFDNEEICHLFGTTKAFSSNTSDEQLLHFLAGKETIYYEFEDPLATQKIQMLLRKLPKHSRTRSQIPSRLENISPIIQKHRLYKSEHEINLMRTAAEISVKGHERAIRSCRPGMFEYQLEAELIYSFMQEGAKFCAYPCIVGTGNNTCTLHYQTNTAQIKNGDLVLIDAGAEYGYYASDVTRTFPANGKFTAEQRAIYEVVLTAQQNVLKIIKPGTPWNNIQDTTIISITTGLVDLGLLKGNVDDLIEKKSYQLFFPHTFGHWLGLDTHDPSSYQIDGKWRSLEPNMVLTVEPGIYIPQNCDSVDAKWRGIGVRIEDDVRVIASGHEVLSGSLPKSIDDIEALMG